MSKKPFTPNQAIAKAQSNIPDEIIEAFEEMIVENMSQGTATFLLKDVAALAAGKLKIRPKALFDKNWLDVEPLFRASGWIVEFDKSGYNEDYDDNFTFRKGDGVL